MPTVSAPTLDEVAHALAQSDLGRAFEAARQIGTADGLDDLLRPPEQVQFWLMGVESAIYSAELGSALAMQRRAVKQIERLTTDSEDRRHGEYRMAVLHAESARLFNDPQSMLNATERAARQALAHLHRLSPLERYQFCWEVVELLAHCGLRRLASRLAWRMHDFAVARMEKNDAFESAILAYMAGIDLARIGAAHLGVDLPRLGEFDEQDLPGPYETGSAAFHIDCMHSLAATARKAGREGWALRAEFHAHLLCLAQGADARPLLETGERLLAWGKAQGLHAFRRRHALAQAWAMLLAHPTRELALPEVPKESSGYSATDVECHYLAATAHARQGREAAALNAYGRYVEAAARFAAPATQTISREVLSLAELIVALPPPQHAGVPYAQDALAIASSSIRIHYHLAPRPDIQTIAAEQGLTPRRLQQAFKALGLPSPSKYLKEIGE